MASTLEEITTVVSLLGDRARPDWKPEDPANDISDLEALIDDVRREIRNQDPLDREMSKLLGEWDILGKTIVPLLMRHIEQPKIVWCIIKLILQLTVIPSEGVVSNTEYQHLRSHKAALMHPGVITALMTRIAGIMQHDVRVERDDREIEVVLTIFRNMLRVPDAPATTNQVGDRMSRLQESFILCLEEEHALELIVLIAQDLDSQRNPHWAFLLVESMLLMLRGETPRSLHEAGADSPEEAREVERWEMRTAVEAVRERERGVELRRLAVVKRRHARFGGTFVTRSAVGTAVIKNRDMRALREVRLENRGRSTRKTAKVKTAAAGSANAGSGSGRPRGSYALRHALFAFCRSFLESGYGCVTTVVRGEFDRNSATVVADDRPMFAWLASFMMEFHRLEQSTMRRERAARGEDHEFDVTPIAATLGKAVVAWSFKWLDMYRSDRDRKSGSRVYMEHIVSFIRELLLVLDEMYSCSGSSNRFAQQLLLFIFQEGPLFDAIPSMIRGASASTHSVRYLTDLVELTHIILRILDKFTHENVTVTRTVTRRKTQRAAGSGKNKTPESPEEVARSVCDDLLAAVFAAADAKAIFERLALPEVSGTASAAEDGDPAVATAAVPDNAGDEGGAVRDGDVGHGDAAAEPEPRLRQVVDAVTGEVEVVAEDDDGSDRGSDTARVAPGKVEAAGDSDDGAGGAGKGASPAAMDVDGAPVGAGDGDAMDKEAQDEKEGGEDKDEGKDEKDEKDGKDGMDDGRAEEEIEMEGDGEEVEETEYLSRSVPFTADVFLRRLNAPAIITRYIELLANYRNNDPRTNRYIAKLFSRLMRLDENLPMFFQASLLHICEKILNDRVLAKDKSGAFEDILGLAEYVGRKFFQAAARDPIMYLEALFWKSRDVCSEIAQGGRLRLAGRTAAEHRADESKGGDVEGGGVSAAADDPAAMEAGDGGGDMLAGEGKPRRRATYKKWTRDEDLVLQEGFKNLRGRPKEGLPELLAEFVPGRTARQALNRIRKLLPGDEALVGVKVRSSAKKRSGKGPRGGGGGGGGRGRGGKRAGRGQSEDRNDDAGSYYSSYASASDSGSQDDDSASDYGSTTSAKRRRARHGHGERSGRRARGAGERERVGNDDDDDEEDALRAGGAGEDELVPLTGIAALSLDEMRDGMQDLVVDLVASEAGAIGAKWLKDQLLRLADIRQEDEVGKWSDHALVPTSRFHNICLTFASFVQLLTFLEFREPAEEQVFWRVGAVLDPPTLRKMASALGSFGRVGAPLNEDAGRSRSVRETRRLERAERISGSATRVLSTNGTLRRKRALRRAREGEDDGRVIDLEGSGGDDDAGAAAADTRRGARAASGLPELGSGGGEDDQLMSDLFGAMVGGYDSNPDPLTAKARATARGGRSEAYGVGTSEGDLAALLGSDGGFSAGDSVGARDDLDTDNGAGVAASGLADDGEDDDDGGLLARRPAKRSRIVINDEDEE